MSLPGSAQYRPQPSIHEARSLLKKILKLTNLEKAREDVTMFKQVKAATNRKFVLQSRRGRATGVGYKETPV